MSKKYNNILIININYSPVLASIIAVSTLGALWITTRVNLPVLAAGLLDAGLLVSAYRQLCLHAMRCAGRSVNGLKLDGDGRCAVRYLGGADWVECDVIDMLVHPRLVLLRLRNGARAKKCDVVVLWDAVPEHLFRQLRVHTQGLHAPAVT